jgi:hypothetical protein
VYGGGYLWVDALAPLSAWEGILIRVDAHTPVGLELANHCRQPKKLNICGETKRGGHSECWSPHGTSETPISL